MSRKSVNTDFIDLFHEHGVHVPTRTIEISDGGVSDDNEVSYAMAQKTIKNLHMLDQVNETITIILNTPGGDWYNGIAIYDAIKACQSQVRIKAYGLIASMGSVILQAADERMLHPNTRLMIHYGETGTEGHPKTVQVWAKEFALMDRHMEQIYLGKIRDKHPKFTLNKLRVMLDHDHFLSAQETIDLGLADIIIGE